MPALRTRDVSRSLDVTSDPSSSPQTLTAPTLQLISPTPRTLIFPTSHNLSLGFDASSSSPYSSPSASPFEGATANYDYDQGYGGEYHGHKEPHGLEFQPGFDGPYGYQQDGVYETSQQQQYASFNTSQTSFHAYDAAKNASNGSLSLTIPELPAFPVYGGGQSPSDGESGSVRSVSPSGSVHSHKRRKSSSSSTREKSAERRPKKGDADYVKRPENAFILFRRAACEERQALEAQQAALGGAPAKKQRQADLSKAISEKWRNLSPEEKAEWDAKAQQAKAEHAAAHPDYVYRPERKSKNRSSTSTSSATRKSSLSRARRSSEDSSDSSPHLSVFVPMHPGQPSSLHHPSSSISSASASANSSNAGGADRHSRHPTRSSSAPRPYHRIDVPRVSHGVYEGRQGSEPTSPSLVPLINEHSRMGGGWDFVPSRVGGGAFGGGGEYPSMTMVSSLFPSNNSNTHARKSSAPSPLQQVASSLGAPSPLSLISPPSSSHPSSHPSSSLPSASTFSSTHPHHANANGGGSDSSSESGSPYTPSSSAPTHAFGMMPSFEETLLEPQPFDHSLLDPSLPPSSHPSSQSQMGFNNGNNSMDPMSMEGLMSGMDGEMHTDAYGEGAFGGWDWPVGEGTLDNEWDVNSIPLASMSPTSLSSAMSPTSTSQLAAQFGSMGVTSPKSSASTMGGMGGMYAGGEAMEFGADPTLIGVGGYDDILSGGAFA